MDKLRSIKFFDYSNHTCVNNAYQDFVTKFLSAVDSISPIRTLRVKSNTKPWFDIDILKMLFETVISTKKIQTIRQSNCKDNFKYAKLSLKKKSLTIRKNLTLRKKSLKIRTIPKNSGEP